LENRDSTDLTQRLLTDPNIFYHDSDKNEMKRFWDEWQEAFICCFKKQHFKKSDFYSQIFPDLEPDVIS